MEFIQQNMANILVGLIFLVFLFRGTILGKIYGFENIKVPKLKEMLAEGNVKVIDVRGEGEFQSAHVPGSECIPVHVLSSRCGELLKEHKDKDMVVICQSGNRSLSGAVTLKKAGFPKVYNVKGGMVAWSFS